MVKLLDAGVGVLGKRNILSSHRTLGAAATYVKQWSPEQRQLAEAAHRLGGDAAAILSALGEPTS